eukprot:6277813-Prorocentrum_lima.AAC.1
MPPKLLTPKHWGIPWPSISQNREIWRIRTMTRGTWLPNPIGTPAWWPQQMPPVPHGRLA